MKLLMSSLVRPNLTFCPEGTKSLGTCLFCFH